MSLTRRELGFLLSDTARALRTTVDQKAREIGMTRAQWSLLARVERCEGLKQADLAAQIDVAPITLGRLVDRLVELDLVERRSDPEDRRIYRLYLKEGARAVLEKLAVMGEIVMTEALAGVDDASIEAVIQSLTRMKLNLGARHRSASRHDKGAVK
jgi:MarR family transcriptional regulator, transcriptional regulator for hemolysin